MLFFFFFLKYSWKHTVCAVLSFIPFKYFTVTTQLPPLAQKAHTEVQGW